MANFVEVPCDEGVFFLLRCLQLTPHEAPE
jgi:hypothetical protein